MGSGKGRTTEELILLEGCRSLDELRERYVAKFGMPKPEQSFLIASRVQAMWTARKRLLKVLEEKREKDKIVLIPKKIVHKGDTNGKPAAFADDEIMVKIHNLLAELVQLQKEQVAIFSKLSEKKNDGKATPQRT